MFIDYVVQPNIPCSACVKFAFSNQGAFLAALLMTKHWMFDALYALLMAGLVLVAYFFVKDVPPPPTIEENIEPEEIEEDIQVKTKRNCNKFS